MAGSIIVLGMVAFVFAVLGLVRPNIAIPGAILGPPSLYTIHHDGIIVFLQIVGILVGIWVVCSVIDVWVNRTPS